MSPILAAATLLATDTKKLAIFMRYYFSKIGYKYTLRADA